jgi:2-iminoacetate synthase
MALFSHFFAGVKPRVEEWASLTSPLRALDPILMDAQSLRGLSMEDAASLMVWGRDPERSAEIEKASREAREQCGGRTIEMIIPEYLTSFCQNDCLYCGYRKSNPLAERVRLSLTEFERELDLILAWGHRQIELVLADDPGFGPDQIPPYIELARRKLAERGGGMVALNAPAYDEEGYRRLRAAGLDWLALWQETYDQTHFGR